MISSGVVAESLINKSNVLSGLQILDVGCGGGILTEALGRLKANVVGLDASDRLIEAAEKHLQGNSDLGERVSYLCGTIEEHAVDNKLKYDAVVSSEVIEHIHDKSSFIKACVETLKVNLTVILKNNESYSFISARWLNLHHDFEQNSNFLVWWNRYGRVRT